MAVPGPLSAPAGTVVSNDTLFALLISAPLVVLAIFDIRVARIVRRAERMKPQIPFLTGVKWLVYGVCVGAIMAAALGLNSALVNLTGLRLIPPPLPFLMIYVAVIAGSVGLQLLRQRIRKVAPEADE